MPVQTPLDLFLYDLGDMYDAEQRITQMLPALAGECQNSQVKAALEHHLQETKQQIQNLEECFAALGSPSQQQMCGAVAGLKQEHDTFVKESPSADLLQLFDLGGAAKTEAYEIASYQGLIEEATSMGQQVCAQLLQANLMQEQAMLVRVQQLSKELSRQGAAMDTGKPTDLSAGQSPA